MVLDDKCYRKAFIYSSVYPHIPKQDPEMKLSECLEVRGFGREVLGQIDFYH